MRPARHAAVVLLLVVTGPLSGSGARAEARTEARTVEIRPANGVQEIVAQSPPGTIFRLRPGVYREQSVIPKDGQRFIGQDGVIFNGATILRAWSREAGHWVARGVPKPLPPAGQCEDRGTTCRHREDLFLDGRILRRVMSLGDLGAGRWHYADGAVHVADDPSGKLVELSVTPFAFGGRAADVVLQDIVVEKYASAAQDGAVHAAGTRGWKVINVQARWNHGMGLRIGNEMLVKGGSYSHNGQAGMGGKGDGTIVEGVELAFNNYANFRYSWEAGGVKFDNSDGLVMRNSCVHHNDGAGIWNDIDNINTVIESNKVFANTRDGIKHEISYSARIRYNIVAANGSNRDTWLWGSQIMVQNSQDVEIYGNSVEVAAAFGNGISLIQQDRGEGRYGPYLTRNNRVHHNEIVYLGRHGRHGMIADFVPEAMVRDGNNRFERNIFWVVDAKRRFWGLGGDFVDFATVRRHGLELGSAVVTQRREPMVLSCDR